MNLVMSIVMFVIGFIVANFIVTRLHRRTRLSPLLSFVLTLAVLAVFTYLATYYKPEGLAGDELAGALKAMRYRKAGLVLGQVAALGMYFFRLRKHS